MSEWGIEEILRAEADAIHGRSPRSDQTGRTFNLALNGLNSAALCLSGGGIRSAAFALGVLQAFATHPRPDPSGPASIDSAEKSLLAKFHYLSTVSGGGYIGSWLSAWRMSKPFAEIWAYLVSRPQGAGTEPAPIRWLRSFSNYLTPKIGLTSADTWAAAALWVRNLILNWFVILPPIFAVVLLIKLIGVASTWVIRLNLHDVTTLYVKVSLEIGAGIIGAIALVIGLVHTMRGRPGSKPNPTDGPDQFHFLWGTLFWSLLSAFLLVHFLASDFVGRSLLVCDGAPLKFDYMPPICNKLAQSSGWNIAPNGLDIYMAAGTLPGATLYTLAWLIAGRRRPGWLDLVAWAVSGAVYSALVAAGLYIYLITPDTGFLSLQVFFLHLVFGVPWVLLSQVFADMIFVGLSSYEPDADADREWFGRSAGWFVAIALAWLVLTFLVFFGTIVSRIIDKDAMAKLQNYAPVVAGISGVATAIFGKSSGVPVKGKTKGLWSYLASMILPVTAAVFV